MTPEPSPDLAHALAEIAACRAEILRLRYTLKDLLDHTRLHHITDPTHGHDCYEAYAAIRDFAELVARGHRSSPEEQGAGEER